MFYLKTPALTVLLCFCLSLTGMTVGAATAVPPNHFRPLPDILEDLKLHPQDQKILGELSTFIGQGPLAQQPISLLEQVFHFLSTTPGILIEKAATVAPILKLIGAEGHSFSKAGVAWLDQFDYNGPLPIPKDFFDRRDRTFKVLYEIRTQLLLKVQEYNSQLALGIFFITDLKKTIPAKIYGDLLNLPETTENLRHYLYNYISKESDRNSQIPLLIGTSSLQIESYLQSMWAFIQKHPELVADFLRIQQNCIRTKLISPLTLPQIEVIRDYILYNIFNPSSDKALAENIKALLNVVFNTHAHFGIESSSVFKDKFDIKSIIAKSIHHQDAGVREAGISAAFWWKQTSDPVVLVEFIEVLKDPTSPKNTLGTVNQFFSYSIFSGKGRIPHSQEGLIEIPNVEVFENLLAQGKTKDPKIFESVIATYAYSQSDPLREAIWKFLRSKDLKDFTPTKEELLSSYRTGTNIPVDSTCAKNFENLIPH